jgi:glycosyltransferase involved in cell wall biosynthesis
MNIAYVCADTGIPFLGGKGASVHLREMARTLAARGHGVTVACATVGSGNSSPDVNLVALEPDVTRQPDQLESMIRSGGIVAVIERYSLASGAARIASERLEIPLVLEVNAPIVLEAARYRGLGNVDQALRRERAIFATADGAAVVSRALEAYVSERAPDLRVRCIPNGVDVARFVAPTKAALGLPDGAVAVGFVGGMRPWHGVGDLIDAFGSVARARPEAHLVIAGTGQEEGAVRSRVRRNGLGSRVVFLGALPHDVIPGVLAALDIGVAPYRAAADFYFSSLKVLEYMAAGLPVVHPSIGDLPETVGPAGLAYPPDDVEALAGAIARLVADADLRRALGVEARHRAIAFTWDAVAREVETLIETCRVRPKAATR